MCVTECSECFLCVIKFMWWCEGQIYFFVCGITWWSELSECLFCVSYKICGGVTGQSVSFVCGIRCVGD